jgi:hypothetical protein
MPARNVRITLRNATNFTLTKLKGDNDTLCHGTFTDPFSFPQTINSQDIATWEAESDALITGTGTEGWVKYQVSGFSDINTIYWDNPFVGNTFFGFIATSDDSIDPRQSWDADCGDSVQSGGGTFPAPPSQFAFFAPHAAILNGRLIGVTQGDIGDETGSNLLILPLPWQDHLAAHAWCDIGIRQKSATSMKLVFKSMSLDPAARLRAIAPGISSFIITQRLQLPLA